MTHFEKAKQHITHFQVNCVSEQDQRAQRLYWLGYAFALKDFGLITSVQYAELVKLF